MSDRIKKIKVKKQDGTFSDYIPIGADAENIDTADGESVQLKLNKKPYYYDNVADMKADTKLKAGDMAITLGYYEANDGGRAEYKIVNDSSLEDDGGSIHNLTNGLKAKLIINIIYPELFGAKGDGKTNDGIAFEKALSINGSIKLMSKIYNLGDYEINLRNKKKIKIEGDNRVSQIHGGTILVNLNDEWNKDSTGHTATQPQDVINIKNIIWNKLYQDTPALICASPILFENCGIINYKKFLVFPNTCYVDRVNFQECNFYVSEDYAGNSNLINGCDGINIFSDWEGSGDDWNFSNCSFSGIFKTISSFHASKDNHSITFNKCINPCVEYGESSGYFNYPIINFTDCHIENKYPCKKLENLDINSHAIINITNCFLTVKAEFNEDVYFYGNNYTLGYDINYRQDENSLFLTPLILKRYTGIIVPAGVLQKLLKNYTSEIDINYKFDPIISSQVPERRAVLPLQGTFKYKFYYSDNPLTFDINNTFNHKEVTTNTNDYLHWSLNLSNLKGNTYLHIFRQKINDSKVEKCVVLLSNQLVQSNWYSVQDGSDTFNNVFPWLEYDSEFPED